VTGLAGRLGLAPQRTAGQAREQGRQRVASRQGSRQVPARAVQADSVQIEDALAARLPAASPAEFSNDYDGGHELLHGELPKYIAL
jgi:hypothetical protein